jgi:phage terminase small subunit
MDTKIAHLRLVEAGLAEWLDKPETWDRKKFAEQVNKAMLDAYGLEVKFDEHLISMLTDQMDTYVRATKALMTEDLIEFANNGARMPNPNQKVRDTALARVMQLLTMLGLVPNGRPKKSNAPSELEELLQGPKYA